MTNPDTRTGKTETEAAEAKPERKRNGTEEVEAAGDELMARVKKLAAEGQFWRLRITEPDGGLVLEIPLAVGAIAGAHSCSTRRAGRARLVPIL